MSKKAIIVITDFSREFWKSKIERLKWCEIFAILENVDGNREIQSCNGTQEASGLTIEFPDFGKLILTKQLSSENENEKNIEIIINKYCNNISEIAIASHINGGTLRTGKLPQTKKYFYNKFHNEVANDKVWQNIETCFNGIDNSVDTQNSEAFNLLWQCLVPKPSEVANTLRSEILTPFIPIHFFYQLDNKESLSTDVEWQKIFKECCCVINNPDTEENIEKKFNKLIELKKDIPPDFKDCADCSVISNNDTEKNIEKKDIDLDCKGATEKFNELKKIFQKNENDCVKNVDKNACRKTIEDFAQCLEKIVNYIESGEETSARN